jgi:[ribosomal protein S18]-alanine N-acetyltransferase
MPVIRRGQTEDFEEIAGIQAASPEAAQWETADYSRYDLWVAICEGRVGGFLVARALGEGESEVLNLAVSPEFRRKGLGRALLSTVVEGYRGTIFLEVRESNLAARNLYKSMGFKEISSRCGYYEFPPETAIVLKFHSC